MKFLSGLLILATCILLFRYGQLLLRWRKGMRSTFAGEEEVRDGSKGIEGLSVIIPFRDEKGRVEELLSDLLLQDPPSYPWELLFVDDHSGDGGRELLLADTADHPGVRVLELDEKEEGKKAALAKGIGEAEQEWVLTLDADCRIGKRFLKELGKAASRSSADLYLLPVLYHPPRKLLERMLYFESLALLGVLLGSAARGEPHLANGAGMLFNRRIFFQEGTYSTHAKIHSGDDVLLLQEWRSAGRRIEALPNKALLIRTRYPGSVREALEQRLRWAGKFGAFKDPVVIRSGYTVAGLNMILVLNLILSFFFGWHALFTLLSWGVRSGLDRIFLILAARKYGNGIAWKHYPLASLLYPFQVTCIPFLRLFRRPKWKGRRVRERS